MTVCIAHILTAELAVIGMTEIPPPAADRISMQCLSEQFLLLTRGQGGKPCYDGLVPAHFTKSKPKSKPNIFVCSMRVNGESAKSRQLRFLEAVRRSFEWESDGGPSEPITPQLNDQLFDSDWQTVNECLANLSRGIKVDERQFLRIVFLVQYSETCGNALRALVATNYREFDITKTQLLLFVRKWIRDSDPDRAQECVLAVARLCRNSIAVRNALLYSGLLIDIGNADICSDYLISLYESMFVQVPFPIGLEKSLLPYVFRLPDCMSPRVLNILCYVLEGTSGSEATSVILQEQFLSVICGLLSPDIELEHLIKCLYILGQVCISAFAVSEVVRIGAHLIIRDMINTVPNETVLVLIAQFIRRVIAVDSPFREELVSIYEDAVSVFLDEEQVFDVKEAGLFAVEQLLRHADAQFKSIFAATSNLMQCLSSLAVCLSPEIDLAILAIIDTLEGLCDSPIADELKELQDTITNR